MCVCVCTARDRRVCLNKHRLYRLFLSLNVLSDMKLHQPTLKRLKLTFPAVLNPDLYPLRGTSCHPLHSSLFIPALSVSGLSLRGPSTWFRTITIISILLTCPPGAGLALRGLWLASITDRSACLHSGLTSFRSYLPSSPISGRRLGKVRLPGTGKAYNELAH